VGQDVVQGVETRFVLPVDDVIDFIPVVVAERFGHLVGGNIECFEQIGNGLVDIHIVM
jgi:hypothetical protein